MPRLQLGPGSIGGQELVPVMVPVPPVADVSGTHIGCDGHELPAGGGGEYMWVPAAQFGIVIVGQDGWVGDGLTVSATHNGCDGHELPAGGGGDSMCVPGVHVGMEIVGHDTVDDGAVVSAMV